MRGGIFRFALCLKSSLKKDCLYYSKLVFVCFDLLSNLHDQKEYDNYFAISREANMLAILKIKIKMKYSLVNPCGKTKHRYPINKKEKRNRGVQQRDNHSTQGHKRIRNYIQRTCIINMVKKQYS